MNITTVIVTFNRKSELFRCMEAVLEQSHKPNNLIIVNNASTDGTEEALLEYFHCGNMVCKKKQLQQIGTKDCTSVYLYSHEQNTGGAGGFHIGLKCAHEQLESDFVWLMDDDGYPTKDCLSQLLSFTDKYDYIMPTSINILNHSELSWPVRMKNGKKTNSYEELKASWGKIMDYVTPFNGVLLSKRCIDEAGYINKDFFIWGDEYEHYYRCRKKGFVPVTLLSAMFYHPAWKLPFVKICFRLFSVPFVESPLRMVCLVRNYTYIYRHYNQKWKIPVKWCMYWWFFIITRHNDNAGWKLYKDAVKDGFREDFSRHLQYLN